MIEKKIDMSSVYFAIFVTHDPRLNVIHKKRSDMLAILTGRLESYVGLYFSNLLTYIQDILQCFIHCNLILHNTLIWIIFFTTIWNNNHDQRFYRKKIIDIVLLFIIHIIFVSFFVCLENKLLFITLYYEKKSFFYEFG